MDEKLIVVLLLITIVLSITSMAIIFNVQLDVNFLKDVAESNPKGTATVGFQIEPSGDTTT
ncbi:MAG: hypothetical protein KKF48_02470 [Nanoarchaeota archaeon]|nr:hypothetical protein [Nanoarchaeota archaeon]MBU1027885.1 hypothetical protein [Nanoarchaeota archaeon]